jgi:hypothetical protein
MLVLDDTFGGIWELTYDVGDWEKLSGCTAYFLEDETLQTVAQY